MPPLFFTGQATLLLGPTQRAEVDRRPPFQTAAWRRWLPARLE
jgi:hypothetical protein